MSLLDLVDALIGNVLQGNLFTDTKPFVNEVQRRPSDADRGIPNVDPRRLNVPGPQHPQGIIPEASAGGPTPTAGQPVHSRIGKTNDPRLLNFEPGNPHPHKGIAGSNPKMDVVYANPPARKLHDAKANFSAPAPSPDSKDGYIIPNKRKEIYLSNNPPGVPPQDVQTQKAHLQSNSVPPPRDVIGPADRNKIYYQSDDSSRRHGPISDLLDFHDNRVSAHPHTQGRHVIPGPADMSSPPPTIKQHRPDGHSPIQHGRNPTGVHPAESYAGGEYRTGQQYTDIGGVDRSEIYKNQNVPPDVIDQESLTNDPRYAKDQQFDPQRRQAIYKTTSRDQQVKTNIGGSRFSNPTLGDIKASQGKAPTRDLLFQGPDDVPEVRPQELQSPLSREDIYKITPRNQQVQSNIAKSPESNPTLGDIKASQGKAPTSPNELLGDVPRPLNQQSREDIYRNLNANGIPQTPNGVPPTPELNSIKGGTGRKEFAPIEGQLRNRSPGHRQGNTYDDGSLALVNRGGKFASIPGLVSPTRFFDIFAIAHWLRAVGKEVLFLPSQQNDPITRQGSSGVTTETLAKSAQWIASQFLLTSMNTWDLGYGPQNAIWNPLSLVLSSIPLVRSTSFANITVGAALSDFSSYKQITMTADKSGIGRLQLMRKGLYLELSPVQQAAQLRNANSGFLGQISKAGEYNTLENPGLLFPVSIQETLEISSQGLPKSKDLPRLNRDTINRPHSSDPPITDKLVQILRGENADVSTEPSLFRGALVKSGKEDNLDRTPRLDDISIHDQINVIGGQKTKEKFETNIYSPTQPYDADSAIFPLEKYDKDSKAASKTKLESLFSPKAYPGASHSGETNTVWTSKAVKHKDRFINKLPAAGSGIGFRNTSVVDVAFAGEKLRNGKNVGNDSTGIAEVVQGEKGSFPAIKDDDAYMPFMFQDLRDQPEQFLYFRAFLKPGLSETFTPDWQIERYYGRVDSIPIYMGTLRTLNLAFDVVAWSPKDLPVMWRKLNKLQSMVYPFYDKLAFYKSGPIVRIRIGDLFGNAKKRGLPGYITSMDWAYDDGIWNIETDFRVPRKLTVSIGFTVLHDGNPGTYPYQEARITDGEAYKLPKRDNEIDFAKAEKQLTFGAGKITKSQEPRSTDIKVSSAEIRKIFDQVRK